MHRFKPLLTAFALLMLSVVMLPSVANSACHEVGAVKPAMANTAMPQDHSSKTGHALMHRADAVDGACDSQMADDCCTNCCVVAPAPRVAAAAPEYTACRPNIVPIVAPPGWSTAPPQRPPRA
ncbi:MAG: hypothetical protein K2W81_06550 [Sphingomonas sp.]|uniref:hypothetical protein n=1 Tax=Sphingomonas sp. TaxID=28214 RepID=UPI0025FE990D|nr:hypothetical protein [Sphingomonas sp.]MBY0283607.1 hypothetical protein [Sphingomonas sp.]